MLRHQAAGRDSTAQATAGIWPTARQHPAAAVRRQHDGDLRTLLEGLGPLSQGQLELFFLIQAWLLDGRPAPAPPLVDADVADAATAVAASLETASRGVIFEHRAETAGGQRLAGELRQVLAEAGKGGGSRFEREAAIVLRAIARAARAPDRRGDAAGLPRTGGRVLRKGLPQHPRRTRGASSCRDPPCGALPRARV